MSKTPAAEAMDNMHLDASEWALRYDATTREALRLLAAVQSGKCKVLEREPTEKSLNGFIDMKKYHTWNTIQQANAPSFRAESADIFRKLWDAAESYAAPSAAEVGDE